MNNNDNSLLLKILILLIIIVIVLIVYIYIYKSNIGNNLGNIIKSNNNLLISESSDDVPKTVNNGEYYDYSNINIQPTITILPAKIYDTITEIKGSVVSNVLASDEYNKNYVIYSGTDKATIITPDMIPNFNTNQNTSQIQTIQFIWTDVNSGKCYVPLKIGKDYDKIVLGDCSGNNAKYQWEDGFIKHINSGRYLQTWNNNDLPQENEGILLTEMNDIDRAEKRQFDFEQSNTDNNLLNAKIIHRPSGKCVLPKIGLDGQVLLSVKNC